MLQGPDFERFDLGFVDLVEPTICPRTVVEELLIVLLIELHRLLLLFLRRGHPSIKCGLKLPKSWYVR
jgi:hypothetical protein